MTTDPLTPQPYELQNNPPAECGRVSTQYSEPLIQSIAELERQIQHQHQRQQLIDQLISAIRNSWDLNQIYRLAVESLVPTMQVKRGMLLMFKYSDPRYRHRATSSLSKTKATVVAEFYSVTRSSALSKAEGLGTHGFPVESVTFWASECSLCQSILVGQAEVTLSGEGSATLLPQADDLFNLKAMPALLMVPLESQGTILGCIVLQQDRARNWSPDEAAFVRLIAAQLSSAIIQTRSFQQVQAVVQERTAQLQRSLEVQAKLYEKSRQQVEQLRKLNEEREEFLSTISHELLTPLTSMTLAIRMLRQAELDETRRETYLDILEKQCVQETHLINDLLALRKLETISTTAHLQKLDLRQLIQDLAASIESNWQEKELKLTLDLPRCPLFVYTDGDSLHRILLELLTNAQKYSDPGNTIELQVSHSSDIPVRQVTLTVANIGSGIAPDDLPHIFDKFRRGRGVTQQAVRGTGIGLALVKSLVEHLDGTIAADSRPMENQSSWRTCFTITLPQAADGRIHAIA